MINKIEKLEYTTVTGIQGDVFLEKFPSQAHLFDTINEIINSINDINSMIKSSKRKLIVTPTIKSLEIGQSAEFDYQYWGYVRSITSSLKKMFGVVYKVHKDGKTSDCKIIVTRIQ